MTNVQRSNAITRGFENTGITLFSVKSGCILRYTNQIKGARVLHHTSLGSPSVLCLTTDNKELLVTMA